MSGGGTAGILIVVKSMGGGLTAGIPKGIICGEHPGEYAMGIGKVW